MLFFKFLYFQLGFTLETDKESWTLSTSVSGNIERPKIDRNAKILEDLGAVIYNITNVLENFGKDLKQLKENTSKRIKKLRTLLMVSLNTYEGNVKNMQYSNQVK